MKSIGVQPLPCLVRPRDLILNTHRPDTEPVVAVVPVVPVPASRIEVQVVRVVVVARVERAGPVVAPRPNVVEVVIPAVPSSGKEYTQVVAAVSDPDAGRNGFCAEPGGHHFIFRGGRVPL